MRYLKVISIIFLSVIVGCHKDKPYDPPCIINKLDTFILNTCESGTSVQEYIFQNKSVFTFSPGKCGGDIPTLIYDAHCEDIGSLGGYTGNTKINGVEFSTATYVRTLWQK